MFGIFLEFTCIFSFNSRNNRQGKYYYHSHFTDKVTE